MGSVVFLKGRKPQSRRLTGRNLKWIWAQGLVPQRWHRSQIPSWRLSRLEAGPETPLRALVVDIKTQVTPVHQNIQGSIGPAIPHLSQLVSRVFCGHSFVQTRRKASTG
jgi:hypothetical protein